MVEQLMFEDIWRKCDGLPVHVSISSPWGTFLEARGVLRINGKYAELAGLGNLYQRDVRRIGSGLTVYHINPEWEDGGIRIYIEW